MRDKGFTLLELLFVLTIIALLAGIAVPMFGGSIDRARESALKEDLRTFRKAIDDYYADAGKYPDDINVIVQKRYLRSIPVDPITEKPDGWVYVRQDTERGQGGIIDVHSNSDKTGSDGRPYREW
jgi:general secretion pathway protein G